MKFIFACIIGLMLFLPAISFSESQILPTEKGTLDVKLTHDKIQSSVQTKINIDFINPQTQKIQEHIDYTVSISKDGKTVFGPIPLTHTSVGSVKIPIEFNLGDGIYMMSFEIQGILFQPIPSETVSFNIPVGNVSVQSTIPTWIKNNAAWWSEGQIDDETFVSGIKFLITNEILVVPPITQGTLTSDSIPPWIKNTVGFWADGSIGDTEFLSAIQFLIKEGILIIPQQQSQIGSSLEIDSVQSDNDIDRNSIPDNCNGYARCITGYVTQVIDGDTIKVDGQSIRFALASAPELNEHKGPEARQFIETLCPVDSLVLVDEDDGQTQGSYGRIIGVIYCNSVNLNEELLVSGLGYLSSGFCDNSEFNNHDWAKKHGCENKASQPTTPSSSSQSTMSASNCHPSYPDFCIPSPPPDLDCGDIPQKRFTVLQPDPHRFDGDKDGIGCESG